MSEAVAGSGKGKLAAARALREQAAPPAPAGVLAPAGLARLAAVLVEFGLLALIIWKFEVQNPTFLNLVLFTWGGCALQHFLPAPARLPFFAAISLAAIVSIIGWQPALWLLAVGLGLIGIAHLPVPFGVRVGLMIAAGCALLALRADPQRLPPLAALWPVIASMFMFRMMVYMYDLRHRAAPFSLWHALAYFFMLPNVFFPLFPVVDYKTFCRSHHAAEATATYQKGIEWMLRGVLHLLFYRLIYQNFVLSAAEVVSAGQAAQFMLTTFLRYLQVSGNYHLIVGMLCMFGFNLPEAFNRWFLPSSFADFWRRANIYWKDFMQKIFFTPVLFLTRGRLGETGGLLLATAVTMFVTWALHDYQTFGISGKYAPRAQDMVFWGFLGLMILVNVYTEARYGRKRSLKKAAWSIREDLVTGLKVLAMVVVIMTAWNYWSASSPTEFLTVVSRFRDITATEAAVLGVVMLGIGVAGALSHRFPRRHTLTKLNGAVEERRFWISVGARVAVMGAVLVIGKWPLVLSPVSPQAASMAHGLRESKLNQRDTQLLERGYYEDLIDVTRFNNELAELYADRPVDWNKNPTIRHNKGHYPPYDLHPSMTVMYKGAEMSTNSWGMRDREYTQAKEPGTFRVAVLGSSHSVGVGVRDDETFENLVEDRLNREAAGRGDARRFEILNFSVSGYGPISAMATLEQKVFAFEPDMILYVSIDDVPWVANEVAHAVEKKLNMPYRHVLEVQAAAGVEPGMPKIVAEQKLQGQREALLLWVYKRIVELGAERGIPAAASFIPRPEVIEDGKDLLARQAEIAREAGMTVLDTTHAYDPVADLESLWIAKWDTHPDAEGHRLLADALYPLLKQYIDERK